jgi:hypothetical protein
MSTTVLEDWFWPITIWAAVACVALLTQRASTAIAPPPLYVGWFHGNGASLLGRMLWDFVVVGGLGLGFAGLSRDRGGLPTGQASAGHCALFVAAVWLCTLVLLPGLHRGLAPRRGIDDAAMVAVWGRALLAACRARGLESQAIASHQPSTATAVGDCQDFAGWQTTRHRRVDMPLGCETPSRTSLVRLQACSLNVASRAARDAALHPVSSAA